MEPDLSSILRTHVERLASFPRPPGSQEHEAARAYIIRHLEEAGFRTISAGEEIEGYSCFNILTDPRPADERLPLVIVGAHYDSIEDSPGADDNASAVAALLEVARWIGPRLGDSGSLKARLQLAAYDLEEYGLVGSSWHSQELEKKRQPVRAMMALEMLGYTDPRPGNQLFPLALRGRYSDIGTFIGIVGNEASASLVRLVTGAMKSIPGLPVEFIVVPGDGSLLIETRLSDHSSFWDRGFQALMITDTSFFRNPHYHKESDTPETLDYDFLAKVTAGICQAAWQLLRVD